MMPPVFSFDDISFSGDENTLSCRCVVTAGMPCFQGHFPGKPMMPAVAQVDMLHSLLQHHSDWGTDIAGGDGLKFSGQIIPGDTLTLRVQRKPDGHISFTVTTGDAIVTRGKLQLTGGALG